MSSLDELAIHPSSLALLGKLQSTLPQALLLSGPRGIGLGTIAHKLDAHALAAILQPRTTKGDIDGEAGTISVESIRNLYDQTRSKQTSRRVIIIDNADRMSHGAQSAFLKLLEEPELHTCFVLTSHQPEKLLPTILSRVQHFALLPITTDQTSALIISLGISDPTKQAQLRYMASGLPAELCRLAENGEHFASLATSIGDARQFLQGTTYQKGLIIQRYRNDRAGALRLVDGTIALLRHTISAKPQQSLIAQLEKLLDTRERLAGNCNVGLQLIQVVL
jgi:DNA polymerase III delta prime subunit